MVAYAEEAVAETLSGMQMAVSVIGSLLPMVLLILGIVAFVIIFAIRENKKKASPRVQQVYTNDLTANGPADAIAKLAKLHEQGILTNEEFQQKKAELLGKM